jgi:hypothetical protein
MICCHRSFTRRKKENKEGGKKRWDQSTNACTNWLQIETDKILKTIQVNHNNFS